MYLRPIDLGRDFLVERPESGLTEMGRVKETFRAVGTARLVFASASAREIERWAQTQHPATRSLTAADPAAAYDIRIGDRLTLGGLQLYVWGKDDVGALGVATIYYGEERSDRHG